MGKFIRFSLISIVAVLVLYACNLGGNNPGTITNPVSGDTAVRLTVQALNATTAFNSVGQVINYGYGVTNGGSAALAGPVIITDNKTSVPACPNVNTVGNGDNNLDPNENITCASTYTITQADLNAGSVTNVATAKVGAVDSTPLTTVVKMTENKTLTLTKSASPTTYSQAGQTITYTYIIKNTGTAALDPAQFVVNDNRISAPINCGAATTTLQPNESVTCTATYAIVQNDMTVAQLTNNATASGGGAGVAQPATATITNTNVTSNPGSPSTGLTKGSTIPHTVVEGEWMIQIARCYGADFDAVRKANPQVINAHFILPGTTLSVPNIGSNGTIYGPDRCVEFITVQPGDTWSSLAQKYNADLAVLLEANKGATLSTGTRLKIPRNSAGSRQQPPPQTDAIRINIPAGSNGVSLSGAVNAQSKVRYILSAAQSQTLNLKVTGPANELALAVYAPSGSPLKAPDTTVTWSGAIPSNGDYIIEIVSVLVNSNKNYTLDVGLTTPPTTILARVADINGGAGNSDPAYLAVLNGVLYFRAVGSDNAGAELWKYDSTLGASLVADINAGAGGSEPSFMTLFNGALYFKANGNDATGAELWKFDGATIPSRVADINNGAGDSNPSHLFVFNNALYFSANGNDGTGIELWKYDGTNATRAADIHNGAGDSSPAYLMAFNNILYFSATSNDGMGTELWKYDGTNATRVSDINPGVGNSNPAYLNVFNNALYFSANANDATGTELWKYDGTNSTRAADINSGAGDSAPTFLTLYNGALYFGALGNDTAGYELWKYDGTNATRVTDINKAGNSNPAYLVVHNGELFFRADGGDNAGVELWRFKP